MSTKKILLIIILILIGISAAFVIYQYKQPASTNIMKGDHNILLLTADPSEKRPGVGAVDMAFAIHVVDGNVTNLTPIYPGGMMSPTQPAPPGVGTARLMLHDSLWNKDPAIGAKYAQETVEANTGIKTDSVIIVAPESVDALINSVAPMNVPGYGTGNNASIEFIRNVTEGKNSTMSRGDATELLMKPLIAAAKDPSKSSALFQAVVQQYLKGNIIVIPKDLMTQFAVSKGLKLV